MNNQVEILIRRLGAIGHLNEADKDLLRQLPIRPETLDRNEEIAREGEVVSRSCLVIEGLLHRSKTLPDGNRQILSFHLAGEIPDIHSVHLKKMDHTLAALSRCLVAFISHDDLRAILARSHSLTDLLWRDTLIDSSGFRTWMVMLGQSDAGARMAHLFCEMFVRSRMVGLARGPSFQLPMTQVELGDVLGISSVHVNRTLQELRSTNLVKFDAQEATILDWERLTERGQFDPAYLHYLDEEAGAAPVPDNQVDTSGAML